MSLIYYDRAILQRILSLYDEVVFSSPEECFKVLAKKHKGKVVMPFISVWRMPDFTINRDMYNDSYLRRGALGRMSNQENLEFPGSKVRMQGLPVTLTYQVDIYASKREICDGLTAELLLDMMQNPYLDVNLDFMGDDFTMQFNLDVEDSVSDNTSISEFEDSNRIYRLSITLLLNEAVIYKISKQENSIDKVLINIDDLDVLSILPEYTENEDFSDLLED